MSNHDNPMLIVPLDPPRSRYAYLNGQRFMTVEHAADQMLAANDAAVMAAVGIIENYRPNNPEMIADLMALKRAP